MLVSVGVTSTEGFLVLFYSCICVIIVFSTYLCSYLWCTLVKRLDKRQLVVLSSLETDERGEPAEFDDVMRSVLSGQTGQWEIRENARRAQLHDNLLVWTPVNSSHYYYAPVAGRQPLYTVNLL